MRGLEQRLDREPIPREITDQLGRPLDDDNVHRRCNEWLEALEPKQAAVVRQRFGLHGHERATLEQVGRSLGVTRERVRQIELEALKCLRGILESRGFSVETLFHA